MTYDTQHLTVDVEHSEAMEHAKYCAEKYGSDWLPVRASGCAYPQCVSPRGCAGACGKTTVTK